MDYYNQELYHYGVKGMKWNVKRSPQQTTQNKTMSKRKSVSEFRHERDIERTRIQKVDKIPGIDQAIETAKSERINQLRISKVQATRAHSLGLEYVEKTKHKTFSMKLKDFGRKIVEFGKKLISKLFSK